MLLVDSVLLLENGQNDGKPLVGGWIDWVLAAAVLTDLTQLGAIRLAEGGEASARKGRVLVVPEAPMPTDLLLSDTLAVLAAKKSWSAAGAVTKVSRTGIKATVYDRLIRAELVGRSEDRVLGLFPVTRYPSVDGAAEQALVEQLDRVVLFGETPDDWTAALIALLHAGNDALVKVVDRGRGVPRGPLRKLGNEQVQKLWAVKAAAQLVQASATVVVGS